MRHPLLHTLVFASTSLLACGGQVGGDAPPPPSPTSPGDPGIQPFDAGSDVRTCEPGWPTTKGALCNFDAGILCCKESFGDAGFVCCEKSQ